MKINLELFEGPLDLLIHLIKKNDFDILDIPIVTILDQYMEYLEMMKELDIDMAGEFILTAAELAHIKSRMLLSDEDDAEEEPDPRADLIARLLEYQKYKSAANWLIRQPLLGRDVFKRPEAKYAEDPEEQGELQIDAFHLLNVFQGILKKVSRDRAHEIEVERISVTERIYQIMDLLKDTEGLLFENLFVGQVHRSQLVVTFLAILEMARIKMIALYQQEPRGLIHVKRKMTMEEAEGHVSIGGANIQENL